jgi:hypothetical protein
MYARARASVTAAAALLLITAAATAHAAGASPRQPAVLASPGDPYAACDISGDGTGTNHPSAEEEPRPHRTGSSTDADGARAASHAPHRRAIPGRRGMLVVVRTVRAGSR